jgi:hypothetical protein
MHLQPLYADCDRYGGDVAADLFARGLCLPSSSSLTASAQDIVIDAVRSVARPGVSRVRRRAASAPPRMIPAQRRGAREGLWVGLARFARKLVGEHAPVAR